MEQKEKDIRSEIKKLEQEKQNILDPIYEKLKQKQKEHSWFKKGEIVSFTFSGQKILAQITKSQKINFWDWMNLPNEEILVSYEVEVLYPLEKIKRKN